MAPETGRVGEILDPDGQLQPGWDLETAEYLKNQGNRIEVTLKQHKDATSRRGHRLGDAKLNEREIPGASHKTELKTIEDERPGLRDPEHRAFRRVRYALSGEGQARNIVLDVRGKGLDRPAAFAIAERLRRVTNGKLDYLRIIGDSFDVTFWNFT